MSDLVRRLRRSNSNGNMCDEAAARIVELESALRAVAQHVESAHDGAHILTVRDICAKALSR